MSAIFFLLLSFCIVSILIVIGSKKPKNSYNPNTIPVVIKDKKVCTSCGYIGEPVKIVSGYFIIEVLLWLCFILPGLFYSLWRFTSKYEGCPKCKHPTMIPVDSPIGKKLITEITNDSQRVSN